MAQQVAGFALLQEEEQHAMVRLLSLVLPQQLLALFVAAVVKEDHTVVDCYSAAEEIVQVARCEGQW